jgi:glycosyltransferase involved in cell wall biosynthesis
MKNIKLSVIMPCFNAEATVAEQLESLLSQQWSEPWELIISDNGSTDNSVDIARKFRNRFPLFQIIDASARKGSSYARNAGVHAARSESVAFCDADDWVDPSWVGAMGEALSQYDVVYGQMCFDKFNSPKWAERSSRRWKDGLYREQFLPHAGAGNLGVRRSVHEAIGGFDERLPRAVDADYYWRLQLEGYKLHYVPEAIYQYRIGRVNTSLPYLYNRGRTGGAADYWLYKKYRIIGVTKEMILPPHRYLRNSLRSWFSLLGDMPYKKWFRSNKARAAWIQNFVTQTGEVVGQFQGRLTNPCKSYYPSRKKYIRETENISETKNCI